MTYQEKLLDPRWQKRRLEIFLRDDWTCQSCGHTDFTLHIHHLRYFPGKDPWEYEDKYLVTYCEKCHNADHLISSEIHESLLEIVRENTIFIKPISQICILAEKWPPFYSELKRFLNSSMINYIQFKSETNAEPNAERLDRE